MGIFKRGAQSWRGQDNEELMSKDDWIQRGHDQAMAMLNGLPPEISSPDEDGDATGGCYNGDYTEEQHAEANKRLETDEYFEAQTEEDIREILKRSSD